MLTLFDSATREKTDFDPIDPGKVRIYSCGPTIWDYAHIGNFRSFVFADVLKRYLRYRGFDVHHVMNLTDIDDRIADRVQAEGVSLRGYTERYAKAFFDDLEALNIVPAEEYPRATEHIDDMVELIGILLEKGVAYRRDDSVYFAISKFADYGRFARLDTAGMQDGARVDSDDYDKENARDFVLWKGWAEKDGDIGWDSPFGRGRPGWHLECSAMSKRYLGDQFDIHTGGIDLIFPHHQNEIAQSEAASGRQFVRLWMHNEFLNIDGTKISKSLGNHIRLQDIGTEQEIRGFRFMLVTSHYRTLLNYSDQAIQASVSALHRLRRVRRRLADMSESVPDSGASDRWLEVVGAARTGFVEAMDDDLNSPRAIAAVFGLVNQVEKPLTDGDLTAADASVTHAFLDEVDRVFGIFYGSDQEDGRPQPPQLPSELQTLFDRRLDARHKKEWDLADELRNKLEDSGVEVRDGPEGSTWAWK